MIENYSLCLNEFRKNLAALGNAGSSCRESHISPDLIHRDVMYASNAGAFTCPPFMQHAG